MKPKTREEFTDSLRKACKCMEDLKRIMNLTDDRDRFKRAPSFRRSVQLVNCIQLACHHKAKQLCVIKELECPRLPGREDHSGESTDTLILPGLLHVDCGA